MQRLFLLVIFSIVGNFINAQSHGIIPAPVSYQAQQGTFVIDKQVKLSAEGELLPLANWFSEQLKNIGIQLENNANLTSKRRIISLAISDKVAQDEGYSLLVSPTEIRLTAKTAKGIFYGLQTLLQLLPLSIDKSGGQFVSIPVKACTIIDYPRFGWRGLMLDVSRHFFTKEEVKKYIDLMAQYKFNVFHWHLTDDNGWRIEIKSLPKLTTIGACRVPRFGTFNERIAPKPDEAATDCGFYTQADIKEIVAFAAERQITIVPEIDVPGHSLAAIAAYPELSITKEKAIVNPGSSFSEWYSNGTFKMLLDNTLNPSDENVYSFLDKVFTEVAALFPGKYLHAGGDECYHGYWEKSAQCQTFMKNNGIKDVHGLQSYFMKRVGKIIQAKGKTMIGWDEILDGGLAEGAAVMSWRGMEGGIAAAKQGHEVVMSPTTYAYLDYMQGDPSIETRIYSKLYLKTCYSFEPVPAEVNAQLILGGQANLWSEKVPTLRHAEYMTWPRGFAIAEVLWSQKNNKDWAGFVGRTEQHFQRFSAADHNISKALYDAIITTQTAGKDTMVVLNCEHPDAVIYYTLDGSFPDDHSTIYTNAFVLPEGPITVRVCTYINGRPAGRLISLPRSELLKRK